MSGDNLPQSKAERNRRLVANIQAAGWQVRHHADRHGAFAVSRGSLTILIPDDVCLAWWWAGHLSGQHRAAQLQAQHGRN